MTKKYNNKYRIESTRLQRWDYGWNGAYFVTICTKNRRCYFGEIVMGHGLNMVVGNTKKTQNGDGQNGDGQNVETQNFASLRGTTSIQMRLSKIGEITHSCWQQIPAHFPFVKLGAFVIMPNHVHGIIIIDKPENGFENRNYSNFPKNRFGPQSQNLASIIRGFKIGVTKNGRRIHPDFAWQPRFHDRIIRDETAYQNISKYIMDNPVNWKGDRFYDR